MLTESGQVRDPMDKSLVTTIKEGVWTLSLTVSVVNCRMFQNIRLTQFMLTESGQVRDPMDKSLVTTIKEGGWCGDQSLVKVTSPSLTQVD